MKRWKQQQDVKFIAGNSHCKPRKLPVATSAATARALSLPDIDAHFQGFCKGSLYTWLLPPAIGGGSTQDFESWIFYLTERDIATLTCLPVGRSVSQIYREAWSYRGYVCRLSPLPHPLEEKLAYTPMQNMMDVVKIPTKSLRFQPNRNRRKCFQAISSTDTYNRT